MKSDKMDIADLLADESFLNYCKTSSPPDAGFWDSFIARHPDKSVLVEYAKENFGELFNALAQADLDEQVYLLRKKLDQIDSATVIAMNNRPEEKRHPSFKLPKIKIVAAAMVLLAASLFTVRYYSKGSIKSAKTFASACGERKNIQLPDGTVVTLNAASKIEIDDSFGIASRNVYLDGEAFFDVKHNEKLPFIVHTPVMDVRALGTAFDVKAYLNDKVTETSLIRGLVEVTLKQNNNRIMLLYPNQKIRWENTRNKPAVDTDTSFIPNRQVLNAAAVQLIKLKIPDSLGIREIAWKDNRLFFTDETLEDIAVLLGRWYGAKIQFIDDSIRSYRFTGMFEKEDLNTVLDFLKESRHFNYTIEGGDKQIINLSK